jgi:DNA-binding NarL/FixJ family response regulator
VDTAIGGRFVIRVCVVEDQTIVRQGLRALIDLADGIDVVAEAADGEEALHCVRDCKPDVLLLDIRMPHADGLTVLKRLAETQSLPATIILTTFDEDAVMLEAIRCGAKGYLLKDVSLAQLTSAIRIVAAGGTLVRSAVTERVSRYFEKTVEQQPHTVPLEQMTGRELQILQLMAAGSSNREIATALNLAEGTVKNHVSVILFKLGVRDRTRAVLKAIELGHIK